PRGRGRPQAARLLGRGRAARGRGREGGAGSRASAQSGEAPMSRRDAVLDQAQRAVYDVIVIGGGITGSGIVRDAAMRGLRCLLLEKGDFASGTSSRSGKLIHGGLRYLKYMHLSLVFEAC